MALDRSPDNVPEYSVSELSRHYKRTLEDAYGRVRVRGEISRIVFAASGHAYWTLKDDKATLASVCWKGTLSGLMAKPEEGLDIIATGRLTAYPARSQVQLVVEELEVAGAGAFLKMLEDRKQRLMKEGLFAKEHKKPLPPFPHIIGVITSPTGAVIRDILHRIQERFPTHVVIWPVLVQGNEASAQVVAAIEGFNRLTETEDRPDVLIVARGGGSIEDLWAFNEENVARAAFASDIPLISAIGHETDVSLLDFVADLRAPTPTAAAEFATPLRRDLMMALEDHFTRLNKEAWRRVSDGERFLSGLPLRTPTAWIQGLEQRIDDWTFQFQTRLQARIDSLARTVDALRPRTPASQLLAHGERLASWGDRLAQGFETSVDRRQNRVDALRPRTPTSQLSAHSEQLASWHDRLTQRFETLLQQREREAARLQGMLEALSYKGVLKRGFAVIRDRSGHPLASAREVGRDQTRRFRVEMHDDTFDATRDKAPDGGTSGNGPSKLEGDASPRLL